MAKIKLIEALKSLVLGRQWDTLPDEWEAETRTAWDDNTRIYGGTHGQVTMRAAGSPLRPYLKCPFFKKPGGGSADPWDDVEFLGPGSWVGVYLFLHLERTPTGNLWSFYVLYELKAGGYYFYNLDSQELFTEYCYVLPYEWTGAAWADPEQPTASDGPYGRQIAPPFWAKLQVDYFYECQRNRTRQRIECVAVEVVWPRVGWQWCNRSRINQAIAAWIPPESLILESYPESACWSRPGASWGSEPARVPFPSAWLEDPTKHLQPAEFC